VSWPSIALLAAAVVILIGAEWPRLNKRFGAGARNQRERARRKAAWHIVQSSETERSESEEFAASVERDLEQLPTIEERDQSR
jgi:Sec-independent protein translocase protein TatA